MPDFRKGRAPGNKGLKLPAEILTQEEVASVLDSISPATLTGKRNRAMVALMYWGEAKVGQVVGLAMKHYDPAAATLAIPGTQGMPDRNLRLDATTRRLLIEWLDARAGLRLRGVSPMFCTLTGSRGRRMGTASVRAVLADRAVSVGIQKRVTPEGLRKSREHHRESEAGRFEASIAAYVNAEAFRARYPGPHRKWSDAHQVLETAPERLASTIGHLCREAVIEFSDELARAYKVGPFDAMKTKAKIRDVFVEIFAAQPDLSRTVRRSLDALVAYWDTVSDLVNRQEHGTDLVVEDGRRLVFQTMLVMREIDSALTRAAR